MDTNIMRYVVPTSSRMMVRPRTIRYKRRPKRYLMRRKKVYRRKYNRSIPMNIVPSRRFMKLHYISTVQLSNSSPPYNVSKAFQSSLYAPEVSGGHQPLWRDQLQSLYSFYRTWGIAYKISIVSTSSGLPTRVGVAHLGTADISVFSASDTNLNLERPYTKRRAYLSNSGGSRNSITFKGYASVQKTEALTRTEFLGESSYECGISSSPSKMIQVVLFGDTAAATDMFVSYEVYLYVELWGRIPTTIS